MLCVDITVNVWLIVPILVSKLVVVRRLLRYVTDGVIIIDSGCYPIVDRVLGLAPLYVGH